MDQNIHRLGFHYYQNAEHDSEKDLEYWLPELKSLASKWLLIKSPTSRAINEKFLRSVILSGITPIIQFDISPNYAVEELSILVNAYAKWGCQYITAFPFPNAVSSWEAISWAQGNLAEQFANCWIEFADLALSNNLIPIFPALNPCGEYLGQAFFKSTLTQIANKGRADLFNNFHFAVIAHTNERSLDWGLSNLSPMLNPPLFSSTQNNCCFRTYAAFLLLFKQISAKDAKVFLLHTGTKTTSTTLLDRQAEINLAIAKLAENQIVRDPYQPENFVTLLEENVLGVLFNLLPSETASASWYDDSSKPLPVASQWKTWMQNQPTQHPEQVHDEKSNPNQKQFHPIQHYLLLPRYSWGIPEQWLEMIRPILRNHQVTIGFSTDEARHASQVTIFNENGFFTDEYITSLRNAGSRVRLISQIGTELAI